MAEAPRFYILKPPFLPSSQVSTLLGRLIKNPLDPLADYTPSGGFALPFPAVTSTLSNASALLKISSSQSLQAFFVSSTSTSSEVQLTTKSLKVVSVPQHYATFQAVRQLSEVREALKRMLRVGGRVYMVVGAVVWHGEGASVKSVQRKQQTMGIQAKISTGLSVGPISVNVQTAGSQQRETVAEIEGLSEMEEEIVALELRAVRRKILGLGKTPEMVDGVVRFSGASYFGGGNYGYKDAMKMVARREFVGAYEDHDEGQEYEYEESYSDEDDDEEDYEGDLVLTDEWVDGSGEDFDLVVTSNIPQPIAYNRGL